VSERVNIASRDTHETGQLGHFLNHHHLDLIGSVRPVAIVAVAVGIFAVVRPLPHSLEVPAHDVFDGVVVEDLQTVADMTVRNF
jgi:hypothetical protein